MISELIKAVAKKDYLKANEIVEGILREKVADKLNEMRMEMRGLLEAKISPFDAKEFLSANGGVDADFHQLDSGTVQNIVDKAKSVKYRKGAFAPGSTARMFHQHLVRLSRKMNEGESKDIAPYAVGTKVRVDGKLGEISHVRHGSDGYSHTYKVTDLEANDPYKQTRLRNNTFISHSNIEPVKE